MLINQVYWRNVWAACVNHIKHSPLQQAHSRQEEEAFSRRMTKLRHSSFLRYERPTSAHC